jgi:hypothetical protein
MNITTSRVTLCLLAAAFTVGCGNAETAETGAPTVPSADGAGLTPQAGGSSLLHTATVMASTSSDTLDVYRLPTCGCCGNWAQHMQEAGFIVRIHDLPDMAEAKTAVGVPADLQSCHTAVIGGYVIEGHVPADAVKRLLAEGPDAAGIAVPGMPVGSPGMEVPGQAAAPYQIILFGKDGTKTVFENR